MKLRYFNRKGEQIKVDAWKRLIRWPNYTNLAESTPLGKEALFIRTSWLGVAGEGEQPPKIYVTIVSEGTGNDGKARRDLLVRWSTTEEEALKAHGQALDWTLARANK